MFFLFILTYLNKIITPYSLRKHPLPLPAIAHNFAESSLVFQLVKMKTNISINDTLILKRDFKKEVINICGLIIIYNICIAPYNTIL